MRKTKFKIFRKYLLLSDHINESIFAKTDKENTHKFTQFYTFNNSVILSYYVFDTKHINGTLINNTKILVLYYFIGSTAKRSDTHSLK